jgi:hypothetical protein
MRRTRSGEMAHEWGTLLGSAAFHLRYFFTGTGCGRCGCGWMRVIRCSYEPRAFGGSCWTGWGVEEFGP